MNSSRRCSSSSRIEEATRDSVLSPVNRVSQAVLNIQPVIPISLNGESNLIRRTIVPLVSQSNVIPGQQPQHIGLELS